MSKEEAVKHFLGKEGYKRLNCAQAIIAAFKEKLNLEERMITEFEKHGGGKAPEGHCGAFYASRYILDKNKDPRVQELIAFFSEAGGSLKCKEIKSLKKLSCIACVERCAEFLEKL